VHIFGLKIRPVWIQVPPPLLEKVTDLQENQESKEEPWYDSQGTKRCAYSAEICSG
jgi:hypothetical protein